MTGQSSYTLRELIGRMLPFVRPYWAKYSVAILLLTISSLLSLLPPIALKVLIDDGIHARNVSKLNAMAMALVGLALISGATRWLMEYIHEWVSARFIANLRGHLLAHIFRQPMSFFHSVKTGDILGRLRNDITAVYGVLANTFLGSVSEIVQILGVAGFLFYLNARLALIAVSFAGPLYLIYVYFGRLLRKLSLIVRDKDVTLLDFFQERIGNIHVLKLYHREAYEQATHARLSQTLIQSTLQSVKVRFISVFLVSLLTTIAAVVVMWYGGLRVIDGGMSFGALFAFYLYTTRLYGPIQSIANRGVEIYNGLASAQRIIEYLDMAPDIVEAPQAIRLEKPAGEIAFHNVCFRYPRNDTHAVRNFTLNIPAGQKVALVGSSGAGKSTIVNLLGRLYDVESGSIRLDGHDIRLLALDSLYGAIGVIPQDTLLFNASIEENIRYGRVDATREEVIRAAQRSHLHEFILQLPKGYDTLVGPRGAKLSGGQRQRVALARMILKDAPIWILDEFTSSLDSPSESLVYENILPLLREKTAIIIAHRLSTILSADRVVVVHGGQIVESGCHADLYNRNGFYRRLFDKQFLESALASGPPSNDDDLVAVGERAAVSGAGES